MMEEMQQAPNSPGQLTRRRCPLFKHDDCRWRRNPGRCPVRRGVGCWVYAATTYTVPWWILALAGIGLVPAAGAAPQSFTCYCVLTSLPSRVYGLDLLLSR